MKTPPRLFKLRSLPREGDLRRILSANREKIHLGMNGQRVPCPADQLRRALRKIDVRSLHRSNRTIVKRLFDKTLGEPGRAVGLSFRGTKGILSETHCRAEVSISQKKGRSFVPRWQLRILSWTLGLLIMNKLRQMYHDNYDKSFISNS